MNELQTLLEQRLAELNELMELAVHCCEGAPEGSLRISHSHNAIQYYYRRNPNDTRGTYIRKSEKKLACELAQKEYSKKMLVRLEEEKDIVGKYLSKCHSSKLIEVYEHMPQAKRCMVEPYVLPDDEYVLRWLEEKREIKMRYKGVDIYELPEEDSIITEKGECVRSKSEKILADKLLMSNIPYAYECPLYLGGYGYVKPDFTVLNKQTRKEYYWEHLGMMDNQSYCEKAIKKIETYEKNGIFVGRKLILTYETSTHPLNTKAVEGIIKEML